MAQPLTRALVVATARATIASEGVDALTLRGLARQLDVTAPALYAYVTSRHDLVAAVATDYFDELVARFEAVDAVDPLDRIRALSRAYVAHAVAAPPLFHLLFRYPPEVGVPVDGVAAFSPATRAFELAAAATEAAAAAGLLEAPDPLLASLTMWAAVHGVAEVLLLGFAFDQATADALVSSVIETLLAGQRE